MACVAECHNYAEHNICRMTKNDERARPEMRLQAFPVKRMTAAVNSEVYLN